MSHRGGGVENRQKKCHVLFEWPLNAILFIIEVEIKENSADDRQSGPKIASITGLGAKADLRRKEADQVH